MVTSQFLAPPHHTFSGHRSSFPKISKYLTYSNSRTMSPIYSVVVRNGTFDISNSNFLPEMLVHTSIKAIRHADLLLWQSLVLTNSGISCNYSCKTSHWNMLFALCARKLAIWLTCAPLFIPFFNFLVAGSVHKGTPNKNTLPPTKSLVRRPILPSFQRTQTTTRFTRTDYLITPISTT